MKNVNEIYIFRQKSNKVELLDSGYLMSKFGFETIHTFKRNFIYILDE